MNGQKKSGKTVLIVLLVIAAFVIGVLWQRNTNLEKKPAGESDKSTSEAAVPNANPLETANLKKYGKELSLNENDFNNCLDQGKFRDRVNKDVSQAQSLGISGTPAFLINGRKLGGAFPIEAFREMIDKELDGNATDKLSDYSETLQRAAGQGAFDPKPKTVEIFDDDPLLGPENAKVTIVEFSDFQCPYCMSAYPTVKQFLSEYEGKVKFVYKHLPLVSIHQFAQKAAEASLCAKEQGKFWQYHDKLFEESQKQLQ